MHRYNWSFIFLLFGLGCQVSELDRLEKTEAGLGIMEAEAPLEQAVLGNSETQQPQGVQLSTQESEESSLSAASVQPEQSLNARALSDASIPNPVALPVNSSPTPVEQTVHPLRPVPVIADVDEPKAIHFVFPRRVVNRWGRVNGAFKISPEVEGDLRFISSSKLAFIPKKEFKPSTNYRAELSRVDISPLPIQFQTPVVAEFTTAAFKFKKMAIQSIDYQAGRIALELEFTHSVQLDSLERALKLKKNGYHWDVDPTVLASRTSRKARVILTHTDITPRDRIGITLSAGIKHQSGELAPASEANVVLNQGHPMVVHQVFPREGSKGFFIDILCDDKSVTDQSGFWDSVLDEYVYLSRRCIPHPDSAQIDIKVTPKSDFKVVGWRGGFRLLGNFPKGEYTVELREGLQTLDGSRLVGTVKKTVTVPSRKSSVSFNNRGRYLPRNAWKKLPIRHLNAEASKVEIRHIPRSNLVHWLTAESERAETRYANLVYTEELKLPNVPDQMMTTWLNVGEMLPKPDPGVYEISLSSGSESDSSRILLTDLHLVAKRAQTRPGSPWSHSISVWAMDAHSTNPEAGVKIELIKPSGFRVAQCRTDRRGGCELKVPTDSLDKSPPFAIIASKSKDFTYLKYSELKTEAPDVTTVGESYLTTSPYQAAVYSDRGVYRPGETAHVVAIVRNQEYNAPKSDLPVKIIVRNPQERTVKQILLKTNEAGMVNVDQTFSSFATTGSYTVDVLVGQTRIGGLRFAVETIVPERMKVTATPVKKNVHGDNSIAFDVAAQYLFGGTAKGSTVTMSCRYSSRSFVPKGRDKYTFGRRDEQARQSIDLGITTGTLDEDGRAQLMCPVIQRQKTMKRFGTVSVQAQVREAGSGRVSRANGQLDILPQNVHLGLSANRVKAVIGKPIKVEAIMTDNEGHIVKDSRQARVEYIRLTGEYGRYYNDADGSYSWKRTLRETLEGADTLAFENGVLKLDAIPRQPSDRYMVRISSHGAVSELVLEGTTNDYDWEYAPRESTSSRTPAPNRPSRLDIQGPSSIRLNKSTEVTFRAPYRGRALVTMETDRVESWKWVKIAPGINTVRMTLGRFAPNAYLTIFLIKDPHLESAEALLPGRAFGAINLPVVPDAYEEALSMQTPDEVRPHQVLPIKLDLGPSNTKRYVTVAAIDQGLLSLTGFRTPDPLRSILARKSLGVETFDTIGWALQLPGSSPTSSTGGDGEVSETPLDPVKPVALWSGVREVPKDGRLTIEFTVPQYRGELRVMAISADRKRIGRAEARVKVKDPLVLQTTVPRFLSEGDVFEVPIFVTNTTDKARRVSLRVDRTSTDGSLNPGVEFEAGTSGILNIDPGASGTLVFKGKALRSHGGERLEVIATSEELVSKDDMVVNLIPTGPSHRSINKEELVQGGLLNLTSSSKQFSKGSKTRTLLVTSLEFADGLEHLAFLLKYPHGCLEQTTSSTRPLLSAGRFIRSLNAGQHVDADIPKKVAAGIHRVLSMQTPSGGLGYWPGARHPSPWATAYATHMLLDARKAGHSVPQERLDSVLKWMDDYLSTRGVVHGESAVETAAYMHYVLALAKRPKKAQIGRLIDSVQPVETGRQHEATYLLKAALYLAGDRRHQASLRGLDGARIGDQREYGGSFYSDLRSRALRASIFIDLFGPDDALRPTMEVISKRLSSQSGLYTTQELAWGTSAIGKWNGTRTEAFPAPTLLVNGREMEPTSRTREGLQWKIGPEASESSITMKAAAGTPKGISVIQVTEGILPREYQATGHSGLQVSRTWRNASGQAIDPQHVALGDIIYAEIRVSNETSRRVDNVALVDRFPAGWEVENPRLGHSFLPNWADNNGQWPLDYMDIRDDRMNVFGSLDSGETGQLVYALRAVSAGRFHTPPVSVEAMYDPRIWGRETGPSVSIHAPWHGTIQ